jgi:hypothetical protein
VRRSPRRVLVVRVRLARLLAPRIGVLAVVELLRDGRAPFTSPQGVAGTASLHAAGLTSRRIAWAALTGASAVIAAAGFLLADNVPHEGIWAEAFAGGAVLTMLAESMMPEAFQHGGRSTRDRLRIPCRRSARGGSVAGHAPATHRVL